MTEIHVRATGSGGKYEVQIDEGSSHTNHSVSLGDDLYQRVTGGTIERQAFVRAAFKFLLDRESKESILGQFDVSVIGRYFPEFEKKVKDYF